MTTEADKYPNDPHNCRICGAEIWRDRYYCDECVEAVRDGIRNGHPISALGRPAYWVDGVPVVELGASKCQKAWACVPGFRPAKRADEGEFVKMKTGA